MRRDDVRHFTVHPKIAATLLGCVIDFNRGALLDEERHIWIDFRCRPRSRCLNLFVGQNGAPGDSRGVGR
jgi:hypothetical protein